MLGGLLGATFYAASIVCQAIFHNRANLSVEDSGIDEESLAEFKRNTICLTEKSIGFTIGCLGFTSPLFWQGAYYGLSADSMLRLGFLGIILFLLVYAIILYFYNASLVKTGRYPLAGKKKQIFSYNHSLQGRCALVLALLLFATYNLQQWAADPYRLQKGTVFEDYESFVTYMEQDINRHYRMDGTSMYITELVPNSTVYYDESGNVTTEEKAMHRTLLDKNGEVVCEFIHRNEDVNNYEYTPGNGTALPITVYTYEDWQAAKIVSRNIKLFFFPVYFVELIAVVWFYRKKRLK